MLLKTASERLAVPLGRAAADLIRQEAWSEFGFARMEDHARERFSRSGRWLRDMAAVGRALEALPPLRAALTGDDGERSLGLVAARLITRSAFAGSVAPILRRACLTTSSPPQTVTITGFEIINFVSGP